LQWRFWLPERVLHWESSCCICMKICTYYVRVMNYYA
jgi:cytochrome b561